jgi:DNA modification methylase
MARNKLIYGDALEELKKIPDNSVHSVTTDPPYELGFMGKKWDNTGIAYNVELWKEVLRVLKYGGYLLAFGGSRTYHRLAVAIEDAGFEIRDQIMWIYGSGFPKNHDVSKAIDKIMGAERETVGQRIRGDVQKAKEAGATFAAADANKNNKAIFGYGVENITKPATAEAEYWQGYGTALKPAHEPIVLARKPLEKGLNVAQNTLKWGTGVINIDGCRIEHNEEVKPTFRAPHTGEVWNGDSCGFHKGGAGFGSAAPNGRYPANLILDDSEEVESEFEKYGETKSGATKKQIEGYEGEGVTGFIRGKSNPQNQHGDKGTVSRFFQHIKSDQKGRYPANLIHDGSEEVEEEFDKYGEKSYGSNGAYNYTDKEYEVEGFIHNIKPNAPSNYGDKGTASRFFYCAKASKKDRNEGCEHLEAKNWKEDGAAIPERANRPFNKSYNNHPTVKPTELMRYLVRLVTPKNGIILDPFMGSGSTGKAAMMEGFRFVGIDKTEEYIPIAEARIKFGLEQYEKENGNK